jgi:hypothetical protein
MTEVDCSGETMVLGLNDQLDSALGSHGALEDPRGPSRTH